MNWKTKLTSRKFWISVAAFLAALAGGLTGIVQPEVSAILMAVSAAVYAACEAYVDGKTAPTESTVTTLTGKAVQAKEATDVREA